MVGKVLGNRYRVLREIGSGGMAWVYLAEDIKDKSLIAVKVLYPQFGSDISYIQRFNREAKLASTLTDSHIVRVLDYGADRDVHYLIMEYIEGKELRETLQDRGVFDWRAALDVIDQLATALEHAHLHGVVHRDIKPQNMMLNESGILKVLDFGIARIPTLPSLTQSGFIGSPYYVSPEQAMSEEVDIRADIYSSGIVLYELLSGDIPFKAKSPWSIISQHISSDIPEINLSNVDVPKEITQLLNRMVAKKPEDRFQTPTALRQAITAILNGQPIPDKLLDTQPVNLPDKVEMADSLYKRALETIKKEDWARAADLLTQTLKLAPHHQEAAEKLPKVEEHAFLHTLYKSANRSMKSERWEEAINNLNGILEVVASYKDAEELLKKARQSLEEENLQQYILTRYNDGIAHFEAERWKKAVEPLEEVQRLSPGYKHVEQLLEDAIKFGNPTLYQRIRKAIVNNVPTDDWWRWGLVAAGIIAIFMIFFVFGNNNQVTGNDNLNQKLKGLYEEAQVAIKKGNIKEALVLLEEISSQDPNYADVAVVKRDLLATPTPTASPTPTATPVPIENPLIAMLADAQNDLELEKWSNVIATLQEIKKVDAEFESARVTSLFCDAYVGRGLKRLNNIELKAKNEKKLVGDALADFQAGESKCSKRTDLSEQADRAMAYMELIKTDNNDDETVIQILNPIVAVKANYSGGNAKFLLYTAYLNLGDAKRESSNVVGALSNYEAALALKVDDPSEAQTKRAELLISLQRGSQPTAQPTPVASTSDTTPSKEPTATAEAVQMKFSKPTLLSPEDNSIFAGQFSEVILEWTIEGQLAEDEYYDVTLMYIFADEPSYQGVATKETTVKLVPESIGVGRAGEDRFYWWVTVRKVDSATANSIDQPISLKSDAGTFIWVP